MKLEDQTVSLELARLLKGLDIEQNSHFYYHFYKKNRDYERIECDIYDKNMDDFNDGKWEGICYSAFTAAEISEYLPELFRKDDQWYLLTINKLNGNWVVSYSTVSSINYFNSIEDKTLANAMAKMLIYIIENRLMELPK